MEREKELQKKFGEMVFERDNSMNKETHETAWNLFLLYSFWQWIEQRNYWIDSNFILIL